MLVQFEVDRFAKYTINKDRLGRTHRRNERLKESFKVEIQAKDQK